MNAKTQPIVFISYSHQDEVWKDRFRPHLGVLEKENQITIWDDRQIEPTTEWYEKIKSVMAEAAVTVCLISSDYLNSEFCTKEEIPYLLERRQKDKMALVFVLLRPCAFKAVSWLSPRQMLPRDGKAVSRDFKDDWDTPFAEVAEYIHKILTDPDYQPPPSPLAPPRWSPPEKVDIERLPVTGAELFGRQTELALLDAAWDADGTHVVSLVAWGGVGKSTLVNKWLAGMAADNYRGALRVYGWSFYSQGTGERVAAADQFIEAALTWFGDADPAQGSPWQKGERLAGLVRAERTLLVLDGLEPLQSTLEYERGAVKDPALGTLISELARENPGLCVITTREPVADLGPYPETTSERDLEQISAEAGRALLRVAGVHGADAELEQATRDFGTHALALNLLAAYLHNIPGHAVSAAVEIPDLDIPDEDGRHPRRVMEAFATRFGEGPEVDLLLLLGLFDRPADGDAIAALCAPPAIPGLTEHLAVLPEGDWLRLLGRLRDARLVAPQSQHAPDDLDAHPLVREHFGGRLREGDGEAWRQGNDRLYEHLKEAADEFPDTLQGLAPFYAAVAHGCAAGRHQEALDEVYKQRIQRGNEFFTTKKLGAFGTDLAALSGFFASRWDRPVDGLTEGDKGYVLSQAGYRLRALGRLYATVAPMRAGLEKHIAQEDWKNAARDAINLSESHLTSGNLTLAEEYGRQGIDLADRSGEAFERLANRTTLATALHQAGRTDEAEVLFREAEATQKEMQHQYPLLYSLSGFRYCDLLLNREKYGEVRDRAGQTLEWVRKSQLLLDIALDHLSLGRAQMLDAQAQGADDLAEAADHLDKAVEGLRQAGEHDYILRGLLARGALHRLRGDFERARRDLDEALTIAERGGMGLHQADAHLEYARFHLAEGDSAAARDSLATAKTMIADMGYHRRDDEVAALEDQLG